jgi:hypothetical protein
MRGPEDLKSPTTATVDGQRAIRDRVYLAQGGQQQKTSEGDGLIQEIDVLW